MSVNSLYQDQLDYTHSRADRIDAIEARIEWLKDRIEWLESYFYDSPRSSHRFWRAQPILSARTAQLEQAEWDLMRELHPPLEVSRA